MKRIQQFFKEHVSPDKTNHQPLIMPELPEEQTTPSTEVDSEIQHRFVSIEPTPIHSPSNSIRLDKNLLDSMSDLDVMQDEKQPLFSFNRRK